MVQRLSAHVPPGQPRVPPLGSIQEEGGNEGMVSKKQSNLYSNFMSNSLSLSRKTGEQCQTQRKAKKQDSERNVRDNC